MFSTNDNFLQFIVKKDAKKVLCIVGATHGDEPAGVQALQTLSEHIEKKEWDIEGMDVVGILGNPQAFVSNIRFVEKNLNRMFQLEYLENASDTYEARRAKELSGYFKQLQNEYEKVYVFDIHSVSLADTQMTILRTQDFESQEVIKKISPIKLNFVFEEDHVPGSVSGYASSIGCVGFGVEAGSHSSPNAKFVALEMIENFFEAFAQFTTKIISYKNIPVYLEGVARTYTTIERIIPRKGFHFTLEQRSELFLEKGTVFAHDDVIGDQIAPQDCYMMMPSKNPSEKDLDAGFLCLRS